MCRTSLANDDRDAGSSGHSTSPWGNLMRVRHHHPSNRRAPMRIGALVAALALTLAACGDADDALDEPDADGTEDTGDMDDMDDLDEEAGYDFDAQSGSASFANLADGDTVTSPVMVEMAWDGVDIEPAGEPAVGEAHLHIMRDIPCVDAGEIIPGPSEETAEEGYIHFGDGSTQGELELEPGTYELCIQLADGVHRAFGDTETISITVE